MMNQYYEGTIPLTITVKEDCVGVFKRVKIKDNSEHLNQ